MSIGDKIILEVCLLIADKPINEVQEIKGDYLKIFIKLFDEASLKFQVQENKDVEVKFIPIDLKQLPSLEEVKRFEKFMITGSSASAYEDEPWILNGVDLVKSLLDDKFQVVGICFGHQLIARALLGKQAVVKNTLGWEVGPTEFKLSGIGKKLFETDSDTMVVQQMHQDHVVEIPPSYHNLGSSTKSQIQGFINPDVCLSLQGHPEFDDEIVKLIVTKRNQSGIIDDSTFKNTLKKLGTPHAGQNFAITTLKFYLGWI